MISAWQIVLAGVLTAGAVAVAGSAVGWRRTSMATASALAFVGIVGWRALANLLSLNGDFLPAISVGDVACLPLGALGPGIVALAAPQLGPRRWLPALVGGLAAFLVNVIIL